MIPLTSPAENFSPQDFKELQWVLQSGWLVQGEQVARFEQAVKDYLGSEYVIAVSSGTAALHLSLLALGIGEGDVVITTAYSFVATANVIELVGAKPLFVDIDLRTLNIFAVELERILASLKRQDELKRVKAILPVHLFGLPVEEDIFDIARYYRIPVVEDAAGALGATLKGKFVGTLGEIGCFSLHPRKIITTGEGGLITTNQPLLAEKIRRLRNHGIHTVQDLKIPGFNYRLTEMQAVLGISQLKRIEEIISHRLDSVRRYKRLFKEFEISVEFPFVTSDKRHIYQSFTVLLPEETTPERRDRIIALLREEGVEATLGTWHMPLSTYYAARYGYQWGDFPMADQAFARTLSLPLWHNMSEAVQRQVASALKKVLQRVL